MSKQPNVYGRSDIGIGTTGSTLEEFVFRFRYSLRR